MSPPRSLSGLKLLAVALCLACLSTAAASSALLVRSGDSLWAIAERHRTTVTVLQQLNQMHGRTTIYAGQTLRVPQAPNQVPTKIQRSVARHRAEMARRVVPGKAAVRAMIVRTARAHRVDPSLALAVAYMESGFQQRVISSWDGIGAMQVLPDIGRSMDRYAGRHLDLLRAQDNVLAGVLLLKQLLRGTRSTGLTLAGYFQGLGSVHKQGLLPQTRAYITNVWALRNRFAQS